MSNFRVVLCSLCGEDAVLPGGNHCSRCHKMYVTGAPVTGAKKCMTCNENANLGKDLCSPCYARLMKNPTCKGCGKTPNPGKLMCTPCYDKWKVGDKKCSICCVSGGCKCTIILKSVPHALIKLEDEDRKALIMAKFLYSWIKYTDKKVNVEGIYCNANPALLDRFQKYRHRINSRKLLRWHGTGQRCNLRKTEKFCGDSTCAVCNICKTGFEVNRCSSNTGWSRYGRAIYTAPNASKSHDYNAGSEHCGIRSILLCHVAPGKIFQTTQNMPTITAPPAGHHSVEGVVGPILNYPELCTYDDASVYPAYVIFYRVLSEK